MKLGIALLLSLFAVIAQAADEPLSSPVTLQGKLIQGGMIVGKAPAGSTAKLDGKKLHVSPKGDFVFGFDRDHGGLSKLDVVLPAGPVWHKNLNIEKREYDIQRIDGLPPSKVTPNEKALKRISAEGAMASKARRTDDERLDFTQAFIWPAKGPISGVYGSQRVLNGEARRPHYGVDVAAPTGSPVVAPAAGIVTMAHPDMYFSGGTLILDHGHGISSSFLHLSKILVKVGQRVEQGDLIAKVGATGRATGPHLDWRMNWFTQRIDPQLLVPEQP